MASRKKQNKHLQASHGTIVIDEHPNEVPEDLKIRQAIPDDYEKDDELDGWAMPEWD